MREFNIKLTTNNKSGPFDIYYTSEGENVLAPLVSGSYATNISASQLTTGVDILVDYGTSNIYAVNNKETCNSIQSLSQTPKNNPYICINLITKNNCEVAKTIQYTECNGNTQTLTISPLDSVSYKGKINTTICTSPNCDNCITTIPDPQYCKYYSIKNPCTNVAIDIKYIDCSGASKVVKVGPIQTIIIQAIADTIYGYSGDCGTSFDEDEIPDPYNPNPNETCKDFIAVNKCSLPAIISYTDCDGNISTLDIPAGASIPFSSFSQDYKCYSGDCSCLTVYTPTQTCGFNFSILGSYTPEVPPPPTPKYTLTPKTTFVSGKGFTMDEGEEITIEVITENVNAGTILYWGIFFYTGTADDLATSSEGNINTGTVTIDSKGKASFKIKAKADNLTEPNGDEIIFARLFPTSGRVFEEMLTESKGISIIDKSLSPVLIECGVRAYDTNRYTYVYSITDSTIAIRPDYSSYPFSFKDISSGVQNQYFFLKNGNNNIIPYASIASARLTPNEFPYKVDLPFTGSSVLTGYFNSGVNTRTETWSGGNKYVYPLNSKVLYWDNTTYKNTNNSTFYLDGFSKDTTSTPLLKLSNNNNWYEFLTPRTSTYALTGSVSIEIAVGDNQTYGEIVFGNGDQAGPAVFRIFGALEKSTDPSNASSWQKIAFTEMEEIPATILQQNPYNPRNPSFFDRTQGSAFLYNRNEQILWYDFLQSNVTVNLKVQTDALIDEKTSVRFTLYWQDLNGVFAGIGDIKRGSNYVRFTIGNSSKPSMFSIIDKTKR